MAVAQPPSNNLKLFTSESVTSGHPDKICDAISDAILDAFLAEDPDSRVAVETAVTTGVVFVFGEVSSHASPDIQKIVRETIRRIGYVSSAIGFDADTCSVIVSIGQQSPDIANGVNKSVEARNGSDFIYDQQGAGDQGIMFGYATDETEEMMPMPIYLAHKIARTLEKARTSNLLPYLRPDGKTQVTVGYDGDIPKSIETIVVSTQHSPDISQDEIEEDIIMLIMPILRQSKLGISRMKVLVNPSGQFITGGPNGDAGLTGRKIIVDTYGGMARHGGGAFSGKDPSKVDRSAAYALRWIAKNIVGAKLARRVEVQVAYAIGKANPVGLYINTFGTGVVSEDRILKAVEKVFDLRPSAIIDALHLKEPIYSKTSAYGHFGDPELPWEKLNRTAELSQAVKKGDAETNFNLWRSNVSYREDFPLSYEEFMKWLFGDEKNGR